MRPLILSALLLAASALAAADADRARRVRVALALAGTAQCGHCRFDEPHCRAEAARGGKPLVLFVGPNCRRCGDDVLAAGGVPCVVDEYRGDGHEPARARVVILSPKPGGGWWIEATLPDPTEAQVRQAVGKLTGRATVARLDWDF